MMEARGKERDVAVQHEAPEFVACSDLNLSGSIVQQIKRPDLPGTINVQCLNVCWRARAVQRSEFCVSDRENLFVCKFCSPHHLRNI